MAKKCALCEDVEDHLSNECKVYPNLQSRLSKLNYPVAVCLCTDYRNKGGICKCKKVCDICYQHHDEALCPKRDPNHQFYSMKSFKAFNLFELDYVIIQKFFTLCSPVERMKLQRTCKYFNGTNTFNPKICATHDINNPSFSNLVFNGFCRIEKQKRIKNLMELKTNYLNLTGFTIKHCSLTNDDLKILAFGDSSFVVFESCSFSPNISFKNVLEYFPYAFKLCLENLSTTWLKDLISAKRNIEYKTVTLALTTQNYDFDINDLSSLIKSNKKLNIYIKLMHFQLEIFENICYKFDHNSFGVAADGSYNFIICGKGDTFPRWYKYKD